MSSAEVAAIARNQLENVHAHAADAEKQTARSLADRALCEHQGSDNVSVVVIGLSPPILEGQAALFSQTPPHAAPPPAAPLAPPPPSAPPPCAPLSYWQRGGDNERAHDAPMAPGAPISQGGPIPLSWQSSQESVSTLDPCSPGRVALHAKLRLPFAEAYAAEANAAKAYAAIDDAETAAESRRYRG